jgi:small subunit ribosomal protein S1
MKQLEADPWDGIEAKYPVDAKFTGRVTNITDYGAFVELEPGIEGLIHVSEMSWTKKNVHPGKIVSTSQEVEVMILEVDPGEAPHLARPEADPANPWDRSPRQFPAGTKSKARSRTRPNSVCSSASTATSTAWSTCRTWTGTVRAKRSSKSMSGRDGPRRQVLDVDTDKERISLGIKQLGGDPFDTAAPAPCAGRHRDL